MNQAAKVVKQDNASKPVLKNIATTEPSVNEIKEISATQPSFSAPLPPWEKSSGQSSVYATKNVFTDESEDENLLILEDPAQYKVLEPGEHPAVVGRPLATKEYGERGPWIKVTLPFHVENPETKTIVDVPFFASNSMRPSGRLYPVIKGILGHNPEGGTNLKDLTGREVYVTIAHKVDSSGAIWPQISSVRI